MIDHLNAAKVDLAGINNTGEDRAWAQTIAQVAIAHALIALCDRLDRMTSNGYTAEGYEQAFLRVDA